MTSSWLFGEFNPQSPVFWLLVSLVFTLALAALSFRIRTTWVQWLWLAHWVLIPYCGLLLGGLSPRLMGLANLDWVATLGLGSGLVFAILVLLVAVRTVVGFSDTPSSGSNAAESTTGKSDTTFANPGVSAWQYVTMVVIISGAQEFHWAFLRGALWEAFLRMPAPPDLPAYWAIWVAAAFVLVETALRRPSVEQWLLQITLLVTTSILFLFTRNFWLCWMLHSAAVLILTTSHRAELLLPVPSNGVRR